MTNSGPGYALESVDNSSIDLSKANLIEITSSASAAIVLAKNSTMNLSKVNATYTGGLSGISVLTSSSLDIRELNLTSTSTGLEVLDNSIATLGNATTRSQITSSLIGVSAKTKGKVNLTNIDITTTGTTNTSTGLNVLSGATATLTGVNTLTTSGAAAAKVSGTLSTINLEGSATLTATGVDASALESVGGGLVNIVGNSTINLNSTSGAALKVTGAVTDNGATGSVYTLSSGAGEGAAVEVTGGQLELPGAQQITVTASQKTGLSAMADAIVTLSTLTLNQTYGGADTAAVGIAATTGAQVNISQLALTGNQTGARVESSGTKVQIGNDITASTMTVTGDSHAGLVASAGAEFALTNTSITTTGNNANGVDVSAVAIGTLNKVNVTTNSDNSIGVKVDGTSTINFAGTNNITTKGQNSTGLWLEAGATAGGTLTGTITTNGANAAGIQSDAANLAVANSTVTTGGAGSTGIDVTAGKVSLSGTNTVSTTGTTDAVGVKVASTGAIDFAGTNNITTAGTNSTALLVDAGATVTGTLTGKIETTGASAVGIQSGAANLAVANSTVTTGGAGSTGIDVTIGKVSLSGTNTIGTTGADNAVGVKVASTGAIDFAGTNNINTAGANSTALLVDSGAKVTGTLTGSVVAQNSDAIVLNDTSVNTKTFVLSSATVSSPTNAVLLKKGELAVTATDSIMTGEIQAEAGAVLDLTMVGTDKAKSVLTGAIINARDVNIDPSTWNITANSDAVNLTNDASDFRFVNADGSAPTAAYSDFKTVTVNTYTGATNGTKEANVYMNTRLNGDDVTGTYSDKIVVRDGGNMSGDTTFHFNNAGGTGAATYDGIKFVDAQNGATVDKSNFKIAGAYGYVGRQGQYTDLADNQSLFLTNFAPKDSAVDGNGFLNGGEGVVPPKSQEVGSGNGTGVDGNFSEKPTDGASSGNSHIDKNGKPIGDNGSTNPDGSLPQTNENGNEIIYEREEKDGNYFMVPKGEILPPAPTPTYPVVDPVTDPIKPTPAPKRLISPDFVTYNAAADVVSLSANTLLGTYHERMGSQNTPLIQAETSTSVNTNSWGRLIAETREVAYDNAAFNQSVQGETMGFQLGHSFWQSRNKDNALGQAGVAVGYVTGNMDVMGDFLTTQNGDAGSVDADTTSLSAYYTVATDDGRYLDAVLQYSMSSADAQDPQSNVTLESTGLRASLEVGKPVKFDNVTVEPQAQLIAYKDSFDVARG